MELLIRFTRANGIVKALGIAMVYSILIFTPIQAHAKRRFCVYEYTLHDNTHVCSQVKLKGRHLNILDYHYKNSKILFSLFFRSKGIRGFRTPPQLRVYIVTKEVMNNIELFGNGGSRARYSIGKGYIFLTVENGIKLWSTDFPHELMHWQVDGLEDKVSLSRSEYLAQRFEHYYRKKIIR